MWMGRDIGRRGDWYICVVVRWRRSASSFEDPAVSMFSEGTGMPSTTPIRFNNIMSFPSGVTRRRGEGI